MIEQGGSKETQTQTDLEDYDQGRLGVRLDEHGVECLLLLILSKYFFFFYRIRTTVAPYFEKTPICLCSLLMLQVVDFVALAL